MHSQCHSNTKGKSVSQFLYEKSIESDESGKKDRSLQRENAELRAFIKSEREKFIHVWNGNQLQLVTNQIH